MSQPLLSKSEILFESYEKFPYDLDMKTTTEAAALHAMDEWSKQEAIGFAEFLRGEIIDTEPISGKWVVIDEDDKTSEELYNLYIKSKM